MTPEQRVAQYQADVDRAKLMRWIFQNIVDVSPIANRILELEEQRGKFKAALLAIEWADPAEFCAFCGRTRVEGHNSVCRMNKHLRAAGI